MLFGRPIWCVSLHVYVLIESTVSKRPLLSWRDKSWVYNSVTAEMQNILLRRCFRPLLFNFLHHNLCLMTDVRFQHWMHCLCSIYALTRPPVLCTETEEGALCDPWPVRSESQISCTFAPCSNYFVYSEFFLFFIKLKSPQWTILESTVGNVIESCTAFLFSFLHTKCPVG